ncbi:MAG: VOC family protein [Sphaerochaetaceae bacterium]|nr:VOC family protein [Sphaerochaetaceae bacterium]
MKFCWTTVFVSDMEASLAFYTDIIGLSLNRRFSPPGGGEIAFLAKGDTQLELIFRPGADIQSSPSMTLGFASDIPLEEVIDQVSEKGITIESGPFQPNDHIRFFYIRDPDAYVVQISYSF